MRRSCFKAENWWTCWVELVMNVTVVAVSIVSEFCRLYFISMSMLVMTLLTRRNIHHIANRLLTSSSCIHIEFKTSNVQFIIWLKRLNRAESCENKTHTQPPSNEKPGAESASDWIIHFDFICCSIHQSAVCTSCYSSKTPIKRQMHSTCNKIKLKNTLAHSILLL